MLVGSEGGRLGSGCKPPAATRTPLLQDPLPEYSEGLKGLEASYRLRVTADTGISVPALWLKLGRDTQSPAAEPIHRRAANPPDPHRAPLASRSGVTPERRLWGLVPAPTPRAQPGRPGGHHRARGSRTACTGPPRGRAEARRGPSPAAGSPRSRGAPAPVPAPLAAPQGREAAARPRPPAAGTDMAAAPPRRGDPR